MNKLVRLIGVAFVTLSLVSVVLLGISVVNYMNVTEVRVKLPKNIYISDVQIPKIEDESEDVTMRVFYNVTNPAKIAVVITNIESSVYMDNLSDPRPFLEKKEDLIVGIARFTLPKEEAYVVRPGESITIPVNLTLDGGTSFVSVLNTTFEGRYYPYIEGTVRHTYQDIGIIEVIRGVMLFGVGFDPYDS